LEEILLSDMQKDALQELANIGVGHAATVLSQMVNQDIKMGIPSVDIVPLGEIVNYVKDEPIVVGIFLQIKQEIPSYILLLISKESAFSLSDILLGKKPDSSKEILSEMDESALKEVANIMICAFLDSIAELLNLTIIPDPPSLAFDMPIAVMDYILIQIGEVADKVIVFNVDVQEEKGNKFSIDMFLLPEPHSVDILLKKLGVYENKDVRSK